jgi:hypothetical protein
MKNCSLDPTHNHGYFDPIELTTNYKSKNSNDPDCIVLDPDGPHLEPMAKFTDYVRSFGM